MFGFRARIGVILPSTNTTAECEYWKIIPRGVSLHFSRILKDKKTNKDSLLKMNKGIHKSINELQSINSLDLILYACTSGSFIKKRISEFNDIERIIEGTKLKFISTSESVLRALKYLKSNRIGIVTPYLPEINEKEEDFFQKEGFNVINLYSVNNNANDNFNIGNLSPEDAYIAAKKIFRPEIDTIFISCTNFHSIDIISILERDLGVYIITSNQASIWAALRECNINDNIHGYGRLLEEIH